MKRLLLLILSLLVVPLAFLSGYGFSLYRHAPKASGPTNGNLTPVKHIQEAIYGSPGFHSGFDSKEKALLDAFVPSDDTDRIVLTYQGGFRDISENHLELRGNGELYAGSDGRRELVTTLSPEKCREFFTWTLRSGIVNYSDAVIEMKRDLMIPSSRMVVTDRASTDIDISANKLGVEKKISIYAPDVELRNYPNIIEYRLVRDFEKAMMDLVPAGYPLWK